MWGGNIRELTYCVKHKNGMPLQEATCRDFCLLPELLAQNQKMALVLAMHPENVCLSTVGHHIVDL